MNPVGIILLVALGLVVVAAFLSLYRLLVGPTALDRVVSLDVLAATVIVIIGVLIVLEPRVDLVALMIVFVLTQFFSTVTVARFMAGSSRNRSNRPLNVRGQYRTSNAGTERPQVTEDASEGAPETPGTDTAGGAR